MPLEKNITAIDANVILRYLLKDVKELFAKSDRFFENTIKGKEFPFIDHAVIAEVVYVLQKTYKIKRNEIARVLKNLISHKTVTVYDKEIVEDAFTIFSNSNLDFVDCLICAYSKKYSVMSFDKDLLRGCVKKAKD